MMNSNYRNRFQIHLLTALLTMIMAGLILFLNLVPRQDSTNPRLNRVGVVCMLYGWPYLAEMQYKQDQVTDAAVVISANRHEVHYKIPNGESGGTSASGGDGWIPDVLIGTLFLITFLVLCEKLVRRFDLPGKPSGEISGLK